MSKHFKKIKMNVTKKLLTLGLALGSMFTANAQELGSTLIRGGVNYNHLFGTYGDADNDGSYITGSMVGFNAGVTQEIVLSSDIMLETGLLYTSKGKKDDSKGEGYEYSDETNLSYIELPIDFKYKVTGSLPLILTAGPYVAYGVDGKSKETATVTALGVNSSVEKDIEWGSSEGEYNQWDYGFNFGIGVDLNPIELTLRYGLGLSDLENNSEDEDGLTKKYYNRGVSLNIAYKLN
ncbi:MAG: hypothetical protein C4K58_02200 [Flavobacteriaceae bacterium]|nr:MAG: hypothetical protein C4K58_02200 [Flavobacteriaceae bacterium]